MPQIRRAGSVGVKADIDIAGSQFRAISQVAGNVEQYRAKKQNALDQGAISKFKNEQRVWDAALDERLKSAPPEEHQSIVDAEVAARDEAIGAMQEGLSDEARGLIANEWGTVSKVSRIRAKGVTDRKRLENAKNDMIGEANDYYTSGNLGMGNQTVDSAVEAGLMSAAEGDGLKKKAASDASNSIKKGLGLEIADPMVSEERLAQLEDEIGSNEMLSDFQKKELTNRINAKKKTALNEADSISLITFGIDLQGAETSGEANDVAIPDGVQAKAKARMEASKKKRVRDLKKKELEETARLHRRVITGLSSEYEIDQSPFIPDTIGEGKAGVTKQQLKNLLTRTTGGLTMESDEFVEVMKGLSDKIFDRPILGDEDLSSVKEAWAAIGLDEGKFDTNASRKLVQYALLAESKLYADGEIDVGKFWSDVDVTPEMQKIVDNFSQNLRNDLGGDGDIRYARIAPEDAWKAWEKARAVINANADNKSLSPSFYKDNLAPILTEMRNDSVWAKLYSN